MQVVHVDSVFDGVVAVVVRVSVSHAWFHSATGQPGGEALRVVISAVGALSDWCSAKLSAPDDQSVFQHATSFQVGQQSCDWLVGQQSVFLMTGFQVAVLVPLVAGRNFDVPHAGLCQATSQKTLPTKVVSFFLADSVSILNVLWLASDVHHGWCRVLHSVGKIDRLNCSLHLLIFS